MQFERFALKAMQESRDGHDEVAALLTLVRSMITVGGCADRIGAERWLMTWLDTRNSALGGVKPRCLLKQAYKEP